METAATSDAGSAADLVSRIRAGDRQAEAELVERYSRGVKFIIRTKTGDAAVAEDRYQETFRLVLEKIRQGDVREPEKLSGFICSVARNLVIDYFRRTPRQESLTELDETDLLPHPAPSQLEVLLQKERVAIVRQVISELPTHRDRQVLFRFYIAEEEKEEICAALGLTSLHFNRVLHRARERYKELYEKSICKK